MIRVIKVRAWPDEKEQKTLESMGIRYIGRRWAGWEESVFHNPFHVGRDGNRAEVLVKFIEYWYAPEQKLLRRLALAEIDDHDILGCWCHPLECHGDIIGEYLNWKRQEEPWQLTQTGPPKK